MDSWGKEGKKYIRHKEVGILETLIEQTRWTIVCHNTGETQPKRPTIRPCHCSTAIMMTTTATMTTNDVDDDD